MTNLSNQVLICSQNGKVTLEKRARPNIVDGEILVRMNACGICGTDISKVYDPYFKKPQQLGHELVATVVDSNQNASNLASASPLRIMRPITIRTTQSAAPHRWIPRSNPAILIQRALQNSFACQHHSSTTRSFQFQSMCPTIGPSSWSLWPAACEP